MGMRTREGVSHPLLQPWLRDITADETKENYPALRKFVRMGLLEIEPTKIQATPTGLAVLNSILPDIVSTLPSQEIAENEQ